MSINQHGNVRWVDKLLQLHQVLGLRHGVMLVGPTASGKTAAWRVLLEALAATQHVKVCPCVFVFFFGGLMLVDRSQTNVSLTHR